MPRRPATDDGTRDAQAQLPDGTDLGQGDEESFPEPVVGGSSGSGNAAAAAAPDEDAHAEVQTRAPHSRNRRKFADAAVGSEVRSDWTRFEIGSVLCVL